MRVCPRCSSETELEICQEDGSQTIAVQPGMETYTPGTVISGRYQVDAVLGVGGFGAVYRCTQLAMNQVIAVKVLRNEHLTSVEHVKRFTREAQAVSKLKHPNTIHTFDFGTHTDGALYLAMEYLEGETLAQRLDTNGLIYWESMVRIATQICHSLTEAHGQGLIHRDLKPENIMLIPVAGDPNFVKVLDFGIAKMQKDPKKPDEVSLTEAGMIMGTPTYMSPEQAKGDPIDGRSDVYSLGVMMYEAMTGRPPFHDETAMKVLVAHIKDPPPPFARAGVSDEPPAEIERVVMQCLEKEPARRPQTTTQLVDRLVTAARRALDPGSFGLAPMDDTTQVLGLGEMPTISLPGARPSAYQLRSDAGDSQPDASPALPAPAPSKTPLLIAGGAFASVVVGAAIALVLAGHDPEASTTSPRVVAAPQPLAAPPLAPDVDALARVRVAAPSADALSSPPLAGGGAGSDEAAAAATQPAELPDAGATKPAPEQRSGGPAEHRLPLGADPAQAAAAEVDSDTAAAAKALGPKAAKSAQVRSSEARAAAAAAADRKVSAVRPSDSKGPDARPADTKPADTKPADTKPAPVKPPVTKAPEVKLQEPATSGPDARGADPGKKATGHDDFRLDDEK